MNSLLEVDRLLVIYDPDKQDEALKLLKSCFEDSNVDKFTLVLKIAEYFRKGSNEFRKKCADLLQNVDIPQLPIVDEIARRLVSIWESNDPYARAFTVQLFCHFNDHFKDSVEIWFRISKSLVSPVKVEWVSALEAVYAYSLKVKEEAFFELIIDPVFFRLSHESVESHHIQFLLQSLIHGSQFELIHLSLCNFLKQQTLDIDSDEYMKEINDHRLNNL